uniref:NADH dehydrogenase subunit 6 n=1 Tax=Dinomachus sikhimensis TaxID=2813434 RepID=A0A8T9ZXW4_9HEMI|nr:NADH dehydrogenase subunit 6 [Dinomachus sikhimensis]
MNMMLNIMITLSFIFLWLNHPLSMGITVLMQAMTVAMITGMLMETYWFSYIIVLIMLSGMLVLFMYMASIASNEKFKTPMKIIMMSMVYMTTSSIMLMMENNQECMMSIISMMEKNNLTMMLLFNKKFMMITVLMVMYLLMTMVIISYIVNIQEGPLRTKK